MVRNLLKVKPSYDLIIMGSSNKKAAFKRAAFLIHNFYLVLIISEAADRFSWSPKRPGELLP